MLFVVVVAGNGYRSASSSQWRAFLIAAQYQLSQGVYEMFSRTKKIDEQQLISEVKEFIGKRAIRDSKAAQLTMNDSTPLFMTYVWIYTYIAGDALGDRFGRIKSSTILLLGNLEDSLIDAASQSGTTDEEIESLQETHRKVYENISQKFRETVAEEEAYHEPLYARTVSRVAMDIVTRECTNKSFDDLGKEHGFDGISKFLIVSRHCIIFRRDLGKLLSKRILI